MMIDSWDVGLAVFSSYDADGWLQVQYDAFGKSPAGVAPYEVQSLAGLLHRPMDPVVDPNANPKAAQASSVLVAMQGGLGRIFVLTDPRVIPILPLLQKGETLIHSDFGSFERFHADGTISQVTSDDGTATGQTVARTVGPTGHVDYGPWGSINFDPYGYRVDYQPGASFHLSYLEGAIPNMETSAYLGADQIELDSSFISIGPQNMPQDQVAKVTALVTLLGQLLAAVTTAIEASGAPNAQSAGAALASTVAGLLAAAAKLLGTQAVFG